MHRSLVAIALTATACGRSGFEPQLPNLEFGVSSVGFGNIACGASDQKILPVKNAGDSDLALRITTTLTGLTVTKTDGSPVEDVVLGAGESIDIVMHATAPTVSSPQRVLRGDVLLYTNVPGADLFVVAVEYMTVGGVVTIDVPALDFGEILVGTSAVLPVVIRNSGDALITAAIGGIASGAFSVVSSTQAVINPQSTSTFDIQMTAGATDAEYAGDLPFTFTGGICQPPPGSIPLAGVGTSSQIRLDRTVLDFGAVACGATGSSMTVTATNSSAATVDHTLVEASDPEDYFQESSPTSNMAPGGTLPIDVDRNATPAVATPESYATDLTLGFNAGSIVRVIPMKQTVTGPTMVSATTTVALGAQAPGKIVSNSFQLRNTGNALAEVEIAERDDGSDTVFTMSPRSFQIAAGATVTMVVSATTGNMLGLQMKKFTITATDQCSASIDVVVSVDVDDKVTMDPVEEEILLPES